MAPFEAAAARAEQALWPLDRLRWLALRGLTAGWPFGRTLARRRSVRVPVMLAVHAAAAFTLAVVAPSFLIAVTPLLLGVPHLAGDVRHLLVRRAWPRWWWGASAGFAVTLIAVRVAAEAHARHAPGLAVEQGIAAAWILLGAAGALAAGARPRGWLVLAAAAALAAFAVGAPRSCRMVLLHGHNLLAVAIWLLLFPRGRRLAWLPVSLILAGGVALASGVLIPWTVAHGRLAVVGLHLFAAADWLAPGLPDGPAIGLTMAFAFLQAVHYLIWLVGIPAADRPGEGGRSWRAAWRDLVRDLRPTGVAFVVGATVLVAGAGLLAAAPTRRLFLSIGSFHAWLELAVLAFALGRGSPGSPTGLPPA